MSKQYMTIKELQQQLIFNSDVSLFKNTSYIIKENFVRNPAEYTLEDLYCSIEIMDNRETAFFYDTKGKIYEGNIKVLMAFATDATDIYQECGQNTPWRCTLEFDSGSIDIEMVIE